MRPVAVVTRRLDPLAAVVAFTAAMAVCVLAGAAVATSTKVAVIVIGLAGIGLVWLVRPTLTIDTAIFLSCATLPPAFAVGKAVGPLTVLPYEILLVLAIVVLLRTATPTFNELVPGILFVVTVLAFAGIGVLAGNDMVRLVREAQNMLEMVAGFVLALLIVRAGYTRQAVRTIGFVLWFSSGMLVLASVGILNVAGREDDLQKEIGVGDAVRVLSATQIPSMAVLCSLLLGVLIGRVRVVHLLGLGVPALLIQLLSCTRAVLIVLAVAAIITVVAMRTRAVVQRFAALTVGSLVMIFAVVPALLVLLSGTAAGAWLSSQVDAYAVRVFGGVTSDALASDTSALARWHENANLRGAFAESPLLGHGLGFAYQLPFGKISEFSATTLGTTYAHNFHLLLLVKAGIVGMTAFALFVLAPVVIAMRSSSDIARSAAALAVGMAAACFVDPMPIESPSSMVLGATLGVALGFARTSRRRDHESGSEPRNELVPL